MVKEEFRLAICCGTYLLKIKEDDIVVMDVAYGLTHFNCYDLGTDLIETIAEFETIKQQYSFFEH